MGTDQVVENKKHQLAKYFKEILPITLIGLALGLICLLVSCDIIHIGLSAPHGSGTADVYLVLIPLALAAYSTAIAINIIALFRENKLRKETKAKKGVIIAIIGLILSLSFCVAIPLSQHLAQIKTEEAEKRAAARIEAEEAEKLAYETKPTIVFQLFHYELCYRYEENMKYRAARDAMCSYIRYTYSNDWQEPETADQLILSEYIPDYFKRLSQSEDEYSGANTKVIAIANQPSEISRSSLEGGSSFGLYMIAPHQSCSKEKNDSLISVWYLSGNHYQNNDIDLVCMYYDYREDARYIDTIEYEETSLNIYSAEFEDFYEKNIKHFYYNTSGNVFYEFVVPYEGEHEMFLYDNAVFMKTFFSAWPESYFEK